jgi:cystathionine gamma-synthase
VETISMSTIFERHISGDYPQGLSYSRPSNPNRNQLELALANLENGAQAAAFSSGSAATTAVFQALKSGDHVICSKGFYGTRHLLEDVFAPWGLKVTMMDTTDLGAVESAIRPETRLIWTETPTNPMMLVTDIKGIADLARKHNALSIFDNTLASPVLQRPLELGADLVMHSTTKYLGGHSDILGGAIIARQDS